MGLEFNYVKEIICDISTFSILRCQTLPQTVDLKMVWNIIINAARVYAPWIMLPITMTIGFIGYNFENLVRRPKSIKTQSTLERREERRLKEMDSTKQ